MKFIKKWLQDNPGLIRFVLLLFVGLNLYSAYRIFTVSTLLELAHVIVAVVLSLAVTFIH